MSEVEMSVFKIQKKVVSLQAILRFDPMNRNPILMSIRDSIAVKQLILENESLLSQVEKVISLMVDAFSQSKKVFFCGNGGSAADAQHLAAELSGRFYHNRPPLPAEALHCNTSYLTAVANDFGFETIYARLVEAMAQKGDVLIALSTSGNSLNIIRALEMAKKGGVTTIGFTGATGGAMASFCDIILQVPSTDTPRIQEAHILLGHIVCQQVEELMFVKN
jgi:D-sedoheptulose 7-phosphate isomerase